VSPAYAEARCGALSWSGLHPDVPVARVARTNKLIHIVDARLEQSYVERDPRMVELVDLAGARSLFMVPMLTESRLIGAIAVYRQEVRPFTDKQIELVTNFAAQAVIAIENTRLLSELRQRTDDLTESLDQQTATSEVLRVISSSPSELDPVFQVMLANAMHLCEANFGILHQFDGTTTVRIKKRACVDAR
jgi:two-component system, NtrC family, sensor kinase